MDDLRVENYDENEVGAKKRSISKRVAVAGGAVALTLGLFSLTGCPAPPMVAGGAGAWFHSYAEDEYTENEYAEDEYTEDEYTEDEQA